MCGSFTSFPCGNSYFYTYVRVQTAICCVLSYRIVPGIVIMMHKNFSFGEERISYSVISFHFSSPGPNSRKGEGEEESHRTIITTAIYLST